MGSEGHLRELEPYSGSETSSTTVAYMCPPAVDPALCKYFDQTVDYWDQIYTGDRFINWHLSQRRKLVLDAVRRHCNGKALRILDLGCGSGVLTRDLVEMGHSVVALDCSEEMVRALIRNLSSRCEPRLLGVAIGSAGQVCMRSEEFDLIVCVGVIQYQRNPEAVFEEISRLLKPGGVCIFTIPNQLSLHHLLDPWCVARFVYRFAFCRRQRDSWLDSWRVALETRTPDNVYERRYLRRDLAALPRKLEIQEMIAFGYGPFTVGNKAILPDRFSIAISRAFEKLCELWLLSRFSAFANRWVIVAERRRACPAS